MKNITIKEYAQLQDASEYAILEFVKPANSFAGKSFTVNSMPFTNVKYCIRLIGNMNDWNTLCQLFTICFDIDDDAFWNARVKEYFQARQYIIQQFKNAVEIESKLFASQDKDAHLWKMAGSERLMPYNDLLPLINLGKMLGQYPQDLGRKPYVEIISLLAATKVQSEVEQDFLKLKK
ncbi:hypothetical protein [Flavobacterium coralii]|uniref:hypothetical protein n=1 Tax=Flavobacterium coralii TaxID=2838017 RepID=UPI000C44F42C|nr:hypothetical protein [Flavobacterium sp.]|tara:strand:- start:20921 stop:21454 length:534 start_codon:yes stop_codon:yes gene_type:complete